MGESGYHLIETLLSCGVSGLKRPLHVWQKPHHNKPKTSQGTEGARGTNEKNKPEVTQGAGEVLGDLLNDIFGV